MAINSGGHTRVFNQPLLITTLEAADVYGGDVGRYLNNGLSIAREGWIQPPDYWSINLSAPGMMMLWSLVIRVVGEDGHAVLAMVFLNSMIWSMALASLFTLSARWWRARVLVALLVFFYTSHVFTKFFLVEGAIWSDSYASALTVLIVSTAARIALPANAALAENKVLSRRSLTSVHKLTVVGTSAVGGAFIYRLRGWTWLVTAVLLVAIGLWLASKDRAIWGDATSSEEGSDNNAAQIRLSLLLGLLLAVGAYVRSVFEPIGSVLTIILLGCVCVWVLLGFLSTSSFGQPGEMRRRSSSVFRRVGAASVVLATAALAFQAVTLPYRSYRENTVTPGRSDWVVSKDIIMARNWNIDANLAPFVLKGRGNTACHVYPTKCAEFNANEEANERPYNLSDDIPYSASFYTSEVYWSLISKPHRWLLEKGAIFPAYWFAASSSWPVYPHGLEFVWNGMFLAMFVVSALGSIFILLRRNFVLGLMFGLLAGASLAGPLLAHFEVRYFFTTKILGLAMVPLLLPFFVKEPSREEIAG
jgi:hypothetical protein